MYKLTFDFTTNFDFCILKDDKIGWFGLYNSRLVGGGVRLRQKRINMNGEIDHRNYSVGWTEYNDKDMPNNPWTYSKPANLWNFLFYGIYLRIK